MALPRAERTIGVNTERWRQIRDLFESALEHPPADIERWITERSDDPDVRAELASLLASHTNAGDFLSRPASELHELLVEEPADLSPGHRLGPYEIVGEKGRGGMGRVYRARDTRLQRTVAIKALPSELTRDAVQRGRLQREARAAAALSHPGICTVYALEEIDGALYIVTEFIEGRTLREEMEEGSRRPLREIQDTARQLAAALGAAHEAGVTHRDLKPENVMRTLDGRIKVLDFGLARISSPSADAGGTVTLPGMVVGTPAYMAPEQLNGGAIDQRTDVFAFGVLMYEYASGEHPFKATTPLALAGRVLEGTPTSLTARRPDLSARLITIIERCLQKPPGDRFESGSAIAAALAQDGSGAPAIEGNASAAGRWWRLHQIVMIVFYFTAAILAWLTKEWRPGVPSYVFIAIGIAATIAGVLRAHLVFTEQVHRAALHDERLRLAPVTLAVDLSIAGALGVDGLFLTQRRPVAGVLVLGLAIGIALARLVLEPATTRAAFEFRIGD